jgi:hypothetical protein
MSSSSRACSIAGAGTPEAVSMASRASPSWLQAIWSSRWPIQMEKFESIHDPGKIESMVPGDATGLAHASAIVTVRSSGWAANRP